MTAIDSSEKRMLTLKRCTLDAMTVAMLINLSGCSSMWTQGATRPLVPASALSEEDWWQHHGHRRQRGHRWHHWSRSQVTPHAAPVTG